MDLLKWVVNAIVGLFKMALVTFGVIMIFIILMMGVVIGMFL